MTKDQGRDMRRSIRNVFIYTDLESKHSCHCWTWLTCLEYCIIMNAFIDMNSFSTTTLAPFPKNESRKKVFLTALPLTFVFCSKQIQRSKTILKCAWSAQRRFLKNVSNDQCLSFVREIYFKDSSVFEFHHDFIDVVEGKVGFLPIWSNLTSKVFRNVFSVNLRSSDSIF